jgi:hypothetical protein
VSFIIGVFAFGRFLEDGRRPKRIERLGTARWTVKSARVAGERTGVRESIGRRQNKNPVNLSSGFLLLARFARARPKAEENRAVESGEIDEKLEG